jgi:hypothetical protein
MQPLLSFRGYNMSHSCRNISLLSNLLHDVTYLYMVKSYITIKQR